MIPWAIIGQIFSGLIGIFIRNRENKERLKKEMFDYLRNHDESILENSSIRKEYEELRKQAIKKTRLIMTGKSSVE